jgi:hypothetical protein
MRNTNWLANIFDWGGEAFEKFNPSAFRFLAAVLPYLTPLPVAWLTSHSSTEFLGFPPNIAFTFVFCLEGIGLWFTSLFVDSVVDWIRSRNAKTFFIVVLFAAVVAAYITLLVNLNVTLEAATGQVNPALSRVITLLCFLPLLTGIGNGYYKLVLEHKTEVQRAQELAELHRQEERQERLAKEESERQERLAKYKIRHGEVSEKLPKEKKVSEILQKDWRKLRPTLSYEQIVSLAQLNAMQVKDLSKKYGVDERTVINWRTYAGRELQHA